MQANKTILASCHATFWPYVSALIGTPGKNHKMAVKQPASLFFLREVNYCFFLSWIDLPNHELVP